MTDRVKAADYFAAHKVQLELNGHEFAILMATYTVGTGEYTGQKEEVADRAALILRSVGLLGNDEVANANIESLDKTLHKITTTMLMGYLKTNNPQTAELLSKIVGE